MTPTPAPTRCLMSRAFSRTRARSISTVTWRLRDIEVAAFDRLADHQAIVSSSSDSPSVRNRPASLTSAPPNHAGGFVFELDALPPFLAAAGAAGAAGAGGAIDAPLLSVESAISLLTLSLLEIVLGIDNIVFIAIL